jgi:hypothetical protein
MKAIIIEDYMECACCASESLQDAHERKVLRIRRQLKEGKYNLDKRLDSAIERILKDLCK